MDSFSFRVGAFECIAINDGDAIYYAEEYAPNAPPEEVRLALKAHGHEPKDIPSP